MDARNSQAGKRLGKDGGAEVRRPLVLEAERAPLLTALPEWRRSAGQFAVIGIFCILFMAALSLARPVLLPVTTAFVVTMMLGPLSARADRRGIPKIVTSIALWLLVVGVLYGAIMLLSTPVVNWIDKAPEIGKSIHDKLLVFDGPLAALRNIRNALIPDQTDKGIKFDIMTIVRPAVSIVTPAIGQMVIFFGSLFFLLLGRSRLRQELVALFRSRPARLRVLKILNDIEHNLTDYLSVVAVINATMGVIGGLIAWVIGLSDPVAWGVLAFVLNFIPYLGSLLVEVAMFMVGLVSFATLPHALIAPIAYLVCATVEGELVTPSLVGRKFTLNPLLVFLALVFWTWLWGPVGAFLAAPLLLMALVAVGYIFPKNEPDLPD